MEDCEVLMVASYINHVEDNVDFFQISFRIFEKFHFVQSRQITMSAKEEWIEIIIYHI
jgi:hypothetical protein